MQDLLPKMPGGGYIGVRPSPPINNIFPKPPKCPPPGSEKYYAATQICKTGTMNGHGVNIGSASHLLGGSATMGHKTSSNHSNSNSNGSNSTATLDGRPGCITPTTPLNHHLNSYSEFDTLLIDETPVLKEFPRDKLVIVEKLGCGMFGELHLCETKGLTWVSICRCRSSQQPKTSLITSINHLDFSPFFYTARVWLRCQRSDQVHQIASRRNFAKRQSTWDVWVILVSWSWLARAWTMSRSVSCSTTNTPPTWINSSKNISLRQVQRVCRAILWGEHNALDWWGDFNPEAISIKTSDLSSLLFHFIPPQQLWLFDLYCDTNRFWNEISRTNEFRSQGSGSEVSRLFLIFLELLLYAIAVCTLLHRNVHLLRELMQRFFLGFSFTTLRA